MKIQVCSDLHLEFEPSHLPEIHPETEVILYAGDIATDEDTVLNYFQEVRKQTNAVILYVLGNHEFYGKFLHSVGDYKLILREVPNLHVLDCDTFTYRGVRFIGCTLWTDYDDGKCALIAHDAVSDFKMIRKLGKYYDLNYVNSDDLLQEHQKCMEFLRKEFYHASFHPGPVVVVTHHGPSFYCVHSRYKESRLNGVFYSELSGLIMTYKPTLWVYGHTHEPHQVEIGNTKVLCNPSGYPHECKDPRAIKLVEVP